MDVVLLDIRMPGADGIQVLRDLQVGFCDASHLTRAFLRLTGWRRGSFRSRAR